MEKSWTKSVTLALEGPDKYVTISNTTEASWAMIEDWPLEDAPALDRALLQEALFDLLECKRLLDQVR